MICNNCRKLIDDNTNFCRFCGSAVQRPVGESNLMIIALPQPQENVKVKDKISVLKELKTLLDDKVLTKQEFDAVKKGVLDANTFTEENFKEISSNLRDMKSLWDTEILTEEEFILEKYKLLKFDYAIDDSKDNQVIVEKLPEKPQKPKKQLINNMIVIEEPEFSFRDNNSLSVKRIILGPQSTIMECSLYNSSNIKVSGEISDWQISSNGFDFKQTNRVRYVMDIGTTKLVSLEFEPINNDIELIDLIGKNNKVLIYGIML